MTTRADNGVVRDAAHGVVLRVDPIACRAHGLCADELPEGISLDEWGYPVLPDQPLSRKLLRRAKSAAAACPVLALRVSRAAD